MELRRQNDIIALRTDRGQIVGFHARNLQVALVDDVVWTAMNPVGTPTGSPIADFMRHELTEAEITEARIDLETWQKEIDPRAQDAELPLSIRSFAINVAQICNLKCGYCAAGGDGTFGDPMKQVELEPLFEQLRMLLHDIPPGGDFKITFLGGEPLIVPEVLRSIHRFVKLQIAGRDIDVRFDIVTNGTLVTADIAELLASMRANVTVSIDGPPEVNDVNRPTKGGKGSTSQTLRGIAFLADVKDRLGSLSAGSVFGIHHTGVVETYEFLRQYPFDSFRFDFAAAEGDSEASRAYADGIARVAEIAWLTGGEEELRKLSMFDLYFRILDSQRRMKNHCGAGKTHLHSDTRGKLTTCQWFVGQKEEEVGSGTTLNHTALEAYSDPLLDKHGCNTCWVRHLCGGGCMYVNKTKTGSKHVKDNEFCIRTRSIIAKGIEFYAEARYQNHEGDGRETH